MFDLEKKSMFVTKVLQSGEVVRKFREIEVLELYFSKISLSQSFFPIHPTASLGTIATLIMCV